MTKRWKNDFEWEEEGEIIRVGDRNGTEKGRK